MYIRNKFRLVVLDAEYMVPVNRFGIGSYELVYDKHIEMAVHRQLAHDSLWIIRLRGTAFVSVDWFADKNLVVTYGYREPLVGIETHIIIQDG